ncbi:hypothetical protein TNCV_4225911 [Trichonephila clavipes]|uniref:Uncharacterized protein n=1 Tax=Trichonephila clavipes TaxID=2585209 RepID=A0A8X6T157_TRICX|nr:hypothetical protein TNCV_4225911 [Trichonephila clavipes]
MIVRMIRIRRKVIDSVDALILLFYAPISKRTFPKSIGPLRIEKWVSPNAVFKLGGDVEIIVRSHNYRGKRGRKAIGGTVRELASFFENELDFDSDKNIRLSESDCEESDKNADAINSIPVNPIIYAERDNTEWILHNSSWQICDSKCFAIKQLSNKLR